MQMTSNEHQIAYLQGLIRRAVTPLTEADVAAAARLAFGVPVGASYRLAAQAFRAPIAAYN